MAVFLWGETDAQEDAEPRVNRARYGDGYEQRSGDGINNLLRKWRLRFDNCDPAIAQEIIDFLEARNAVEAFDWTPKWGTVATKVVCPSWQRSKAGRGLVNISCSFEERAEP
jgi:phage-related protein